MNALAAAPDTTPDIRNKAIDAKYAELPFLWLTKQAKTADAHDRLKPEKKPLPTHKDYIRAWFEVWKGDDPHNPPWLFCDKPRQFVISWLDRALNTHECQYVPYRLAGVCSKNETDSDAQLERAWYIYENQDPWVKAMHPAKKLSDPLRIEWANGSVFVSIAKGPNQARQYTFSSFTVEEAAYQEWLEDMRTAVWPTLFGGGRYTEITTAHPSTFAEFIHALKREAIAHHVLMPGVQIWRGRPQSIPDDNGEFKEIPSSHVAISIDTECDPDPETQRKLAQARATMSEARYAKEYKRDYTALSGQRVWPELSQKIHGFDPQLVTIEPAWPRVRVIDYGYNNPTCVIWAAVAPAGWRGCMDVNKKPISPLLVYRELYARGQRIEAIAHAVHRMSAGEVYRVSLIDPSTNKHDGNEAAGRSVFQKFGDLGISVVRANNTVIPGLDEVRRRLCVYNGVPALLISHECHHVWRESLGYRYKELGEHQRGLMNVPEEVRKVDDHGPDDIRYLCMWDPMPDAAPDTCPGKGTIGHLLGQMDRADRRRPRGGAYSFNPLARFMR